MYSYASSTADIKAKIIENISRVFIKNKIIKLYVADKTFNDVFNVNKNLQRVTKIKDANIILTNDSAKFKDLKSPIYVISTSYKDYKNALSFDCAAFFWQKGRPNLILNSKVIKDKKIKLSKQYNRFVE